MHLRVDGAVDLIAAGLEHLQGDGVFIAGDLHEVVDHLVDDLIFKVGEVVAGAVVLAGAVAEHQLLRHGLVVLRLADIALVEHFAQDQLLALLVLLEVEIGIIPGGVVGNADEGSTLSQGEILHVLAEVDLRGGLDAVAALAQGDDVEVKFQDLILRVALFVLQGAENLHQLPAHRHLVFMGAVFDELLGDGGCAVGGLAAEEHIETGSDGAQPVHAVMLVKPLILDGDTGVLEVLRDVLQSHPNAVFTLVELFELLPLPCLAVLIVDHRGLIQSKALNGEVHLVGEVVLNIHCKDAGEDQ